MWKFRKWFVVLVGCAMVVLGGCSGGGTQSSGSVVTPAADSQPSKEAAKPAGITGPVILKKFLQVPIAEGDVNTLIVNPLKQKYPQLALEFAGRTLLPAEIWRIESQRVMRRI
jgi:hypothetical protein